MSFLYPRIVQLSRPNAQSGVGIQPYQGLNKVNETILLSNIPASIQHKSELKIPFANLPGDTSGEDAYYIFIQLQYLSLGTVNNRDIFTDDLNNRYQVTANYWDSLGYRLKCELLQN